MLHPVALQRGVPGVHFPLGSLKPRLGLVLSGLSPRPCPLSPRPEHGGLSGLRPQHVSEMPGEALGGAQARP